MVQFVLRWQKCLQRQVQTVQWLQQGEQAWRPGGEGTGRLVQRHLFVWLGDGTTEQHAAQGETQSKEGAHPAFQGSKPCVILQHHPQGEREGQNGRLH